MAYPATLDDMDATRGTTGDTLASPNHITHHALEDATLESLQAKVGIDSSAVTTSHDYKLSNVAGSDKAVSLTGTEVLTNKTLTSPTINVGSDADQDIYIRNASGDFTRVAMGAANELFGVNAGGTAVGYQALTAVTLNEKDAIAGTSGTAVSASNKLIDADDVSDAAASGKVVRATGTALPALDGSSLTSVPTGKVLVDASSVSIASDTTEITLYTTTLAAGSLSTNNAVSIKIMFTGFKLTDTKTCTFRLKYGATTIATMVMTGQAIANQDGFLEGYLVASGATGTQDGNLMFMSGSPTGTVSLTPEGGTDVATGTATEDSTGALTLAVSAQMNNSSVNDVITTIMGVMQLIR